MATDTVVQTALLLPEILDLIFRHVHGTYCSHKDLATCGLVNRFWYQESMPNLWRDLTTSNCTLPSLFHNIGPARRQFYANFIERADLTLAGISTAAETDEALHGLAFPRLTVLKIWVPNPGYDDPPHVPSIQNHRIVALEIDPHYEMCYPEFFGVLEEEWEVILEQIPNVFPDLERFEFKDCSLVEQRVLERFAGRLPRLEVLDYSLVRSEYGQSACPYTLKWKPRP
ncbi:putative rta1 domain protein [Mycena venus]|uniref:Putative rta1 domain protein n=1 Tax=Mycena venus TaxID=2733690 RepID=A0A8H6Y185_9AGAR|nr:putative rta1 domain protein [Mycena venus]